MAAAFKSLGAEALLVTSSQPDAVAAAQDILRHEGIALGTVTSSLVASALRYCRSASAPCDVLVMAVDSPCSHPQLPQASQQPHKCGKVGIETALIHAGQEPDPTTGAINVPIYASSTYVQQSPGIHRGYEYSRTGNPTRHAYEECLAVLEGGGAGFAFASGLAASTTLLEMLEQGCHVVLSDDCYGGTFRLFNCKAKSTGMTITRVNMTNPENTKAAINEKTRLVWIETPTNPMLNLVPLKATLEAIRSTPNGASIVAVVDNTFASPVLQNPLQYGYDVVIHSSTKYIAGHSDIVGGAIIVNKDREEMTQRIKFLSNALGGIASPFDSYLSLRGLKTLHVRMERHCSNAMKIAQWLTSHPAVETVIYPGLPSHPQHALARDQMRDFGGMIAVILKGDLSRARRFLERCKLFALAESLGGVESLIESPAVMTHAVLGPEKRRELGILDGMVRLSVGIENVEDLIADLQYALAD
jgi:cystathionine beta-lyase/cystathionine gamma-synthase